MSLRIVLLVALLFTLAPRTASACVCYNDAGNDIPTDPQSYCQTNAQMCYPDTATATSPTGCSFGEPSCSFDSGYCNCTTDSTVKPFTCEDVCEAAGLNFVALTAPAASTPAEPTTPPKKLITPTLSVEIPGVKFTEGVISGGTISVNFLGDYIAGVYKYLLGTATVIAIVMIMISGLEWSFSGGSIMGTDNKASASRAKTRIRNSVTGLVLILATYILLYTVNPNLVLLKFPTIDVTQGIPLETLVPGPVGSATRLCETIDDCKDFCNNRDLVPDKTSGMAVPSQVEVLKKQTGLYIIGTESLLPDTKQKIETAARIANEKGFSIVVVDAFRSLKEQVKLACDEIARAEAVGESPKIPSKIAWPGGSAHGSGTAVDARLGDKSGNSLWNVGFTNQKDAKLEYVKLMAEIMYEAGFQRYHKEIWHFQTNTGSCTSNQCFGYHGDAGCEC